MKKFRKVLALCLALVLVVSAFAACGSKGDTDADKDAPAKDLKVGFIFLHDEQSTYDKNFMDAARAIAGGKVDLSQLITHEFKLEEADKAFELGAHPTDDVVKIVVKMK